MPRLPHPTHPAPRRRSTLHLAHRRRQACATSGEENPERTCTFSYDHTYRDHAPAGNRQRCAPLVLPIPSNFFFVAPHHPLRTPLVPTQRRSTPARARTRSVSEAPLPLQGRARAPRRPASGAGGAAEIRPPSAPSPPALAGARRPARATAGRVPRLGRPRAFPTGAAPPVPPRPFRSAFPSWRRARPRHWSTHRPQMP